jgi:hypothetical protein
MIVSHHMLMLAGGALVGIGGAIFLIALAILFILLSEIDS